MGANLLIWAADGDDARNCVVGRVGFYDDWGIGNPVHEDQHGGKRIFEMLKGGTALIGEDPRYSLSGESGQGDHNVRVFVDESPVEVSESQEGLDVLHLT